MALSSARLLNRSLFQGLIQTGAWAIFYDFNCIDLDVLSVVAQQIATIQRAKAKRAIKILFEDTTLKLDASCYVFVTINPDYAGKLDFGQLIEQVSL